MTLNNRIVLNNNNVFDSQTRNSSNLQNSSIINDFSENKLALYAENINFDSIIYLNAKISFDLTKWNLTINSKINNLQKQKT